ncbi:hypothetical protein ABES80_13180 [Bacillus gobiensis]|uniref:hypothetical protein n=1 Tax=Bacillus gobiensis TaxID=1441095 RepID=UPI003D24BD76
MKTMKNELSFIFNTERLILDQDLPKFEDKLDNVIYSSSDLFVYSKDCLEIMISDLGTVSISVYLDQINDLKKLLPRIIEEYKLLTSIDSMFSSNKNFKVIAPNEIAPDIKSELISLKYDYTIANNEELSTLSVTN